MNHKICSIVQYTCKSQRFFHLVFSYKNATDAFLMLAESRSRRKDKLRYRYPRGESYLDVIQRCVKKIACNRSGEICIILVDNL